ncbi:Cullin-domain-containing protein [Hanseniaspora valbyensis NRRL Y-1626]|uniref:Cullin-domain-containing protein n=1 Tax=Hanseniaspora valbyensis NRRL Y-1626 TaxID=766949 RepID=A0A1B7TBM3_9ASCO|nr:Cullin-domain-containing protein [Hanseniaspora valbyensis NRRL Y-1626]
MSEVLNNNSQSADDMLINTWDFIEPSIRQLLSNVNMSTPMSQVEKNCNSALYMKVYTSVYNFCVERSRSISNKEIENMNVLKSTTNNQPKQQELLSGGDLYYKLEAYLIHFLKEVVPTDKLDDSNKNTDFLNFYKKTFPKYVKVISSLDNIFDYMNRFWIESERSNGNSSVFKIYQLCLKCWRDIIYEPNEERLIKLTIDSCNEYRTLQLTHVIKLGEEDEEENGDKEDIDMDFDIKDIRKTCKDLVQRIYWSVNSSMMICIDASDLKRSTDALYNHFKTKFEKDTFEFYQVFTKNIIDKKSLNYYVKFVNKIREFEDTNINELTKVYNHGTLHGVLDDVLVINNFDRFLNTFGTSYHKIINELDLNKELSDIDYTQNKEYKLIKCIWDSIKLHPSLVHRLSDFFGACCSKFCCDKITFSIKPLDFQNYIKSLLKLYQLNMKLIKDVMSSQAVFVKSFDGCCKNFINHNSFAQPDMKELSHQPEILAKYADSILKKNSKNTRQVVDFDIEVKNITILFQYLEDKETFELEYRKLFTKRLIHGTTKGEKYEIKVIASLQQTNSLEYTGKISKMLQDITSSRQLLRTESVVFEPSVVAKAMWPFPEDHESEEEEFNSVMSLPSEIKPIFDQFEARYQERHQGRVLNWLWSLSKTEIEADIAKAGRPKFKFILTIYQTIILLSLQNSNTIKLSTLAQNFQIKYVIAHILPFFKKKLINLVRDDGTPISALSELRNFEKISIKLNVPYKALNQSINFTIGINPIMAEQILNGTFRD